MSKLKENTKKIQDLTEQISNLPKDSYYDDFWDNFQQNGERTSYMRAFCGAGWNDITFKPKYDIKPVGAIQEMFGNSTITDLKGICEQQGIELDFSQVTGFYYAFANITITNMGVIDTRKCGELSRVFYPASSLVSVENFILKDDGSQKFTTVFQLMNSLENFIVSGVIGQNGFNIASAPKLSKASITSIINALSTTTSGLSVGISKTAVNKAFETKENAKDGASSAEWQALVDTKKNWTISLG